MLTRKAPFVLFLALLLVLTAVVPTAFSQDEKIKLLYWDTYDEVNNANRIPIVQAIIDRFQEEHPNVEIVREVYEFQQMQTLINTALASGTGPDIVLYGTGAGFMGPLVDANLLLPLAPFGLAAHKAA